MESYYWLIFMALCIIIEIITLGLTTIWFAIGALFAFVAAVCGGDLVIQIIVFFAVSLITLFFTRPIATKYFNKDRVPTNAESLVGVHAKVIERIDNINTTGRVNVRGQEWMARTEDESVIEEGAMVEVVGISGAKVMVKYIKEEV
jgi:membrane protein implicated in regulation of membrane protease activity